MDGQQTSISIEAAAAARFAELFRALPVACIAFDAENEVFEWNDAAARATGTPAAQALGAHVERLLDGGERFHELIERCWHGEAVFDQSLDLTLLDACRTCLVSMVPVHAGGGSVTGVLCAIVDVSRERTLAAMLQEKLEELDRTAAQLERLSTTDALTGLSNTRRFREALNTASAAVCLEGDLSLIMLDVDHFKSFNDTFGHQAGDEVLAIVGEVLRELGRPGDIPARYGGEEFAVILPATTEAEALTVAEGLRAALEAWPCAFRTITASFGVAQLARDATASELIAAADRALYASKHAGRNRATPASSLAAPPNPFDTSAWLARRETCMHDPFAPAAKQHVQRAMGLHFTWKNQVRGALAAGKPPLPMPQDAWQQWLSASPTAPAASPLRAALADALHALTLCIAPHDRSPESIERRCRRIEVLLHAWAA